MHRTNIYLTDEQERGLDARARRTGSTRSAVIRALLDAGLAAEPAVDPLAEAFGDLADGYEQLVGELFDDDPDLRIER